MLWPPFRISARAADCAKYLSGATPPLIRVPRQCTSQYHWSSQQGKVRIDQGLRRGSAE